MRTAAVVDAGATEFRLGYAGEIAASHCLPVADDGTASLAQLFNSASGHLRPSFAVVLEKTTRDTPTRQKLIRTFFEECDVRSLYLMRAAAGAVYAAGRSSGEVLELSETAHEFASVSDGFIDQALIFRGECTPRSLFQRLRQKFQNWSAADFRGALVDNPRPVLPDGTLLDLSFYATDVRDLLTAGLAAPRSPRPLLLCGRGYSSPALASPVLEVLAGQHVDVLNGPDALRRDLPFVGASIIGSIAEMGDVCISRAAYQESGDALLNKLFN